MNCIAEAILLSAGLIWLVPLLPLLAAALIGFRMLHGVQGDAAEPVIPFRRDSSIDVDYRYIPSGLEGAFDGDKYWVWNIDASYTRAESSENQPSDW